MLSFWKRDERVREMKEGFVESVGGIVRGCFRS